MMEVAACLKLDINAPIPMLKTMSIQPENMDHPSNNQVYISFSFYGA